MIARRGESKLEPDLTVFVAAEAPRRALERKNSTVAIGKLHGFGP